MPHTQTEKDYPIQKIWILKSFLKMFPYVIIFTILFFLNYNHGYYNMYVILFLAFSVFGLIYSYLSLINFHFSLDTNYLSLRQGVLSKQERHIPYGVIQNVIVKQSLFDRLLGLSSVNVENAAQSGGALSQSGSAKIFGMEVGKTRNKEVEKVGFRDNKVVIPGLKKPQAEELKNHILTKMKENPIDDNQSGL